MELLLCISGGPPTQTRTMLHGGRVTPPARRRDWGQEFDAVAMARGRSAHLRGAHRLRDDHGSTEAHFKMAANLDLDGTPRHEHDHVSTTSVHGAAGAEYRADIRGSRRANMARPHIYKGRRVPLCRMRARYWGMNVNAHAFAPRVMGVAGAPAGMNVNARAFVPVAVCAAHAPVQVATVSASNTVIAGDTHGPMCPANHRVTPTGAPAPHVRVGSAAPAVRAVHVLRSKAIIFWY